MQRSQYNKKNDFSFKINTDNLFGYFFCKKKVLILGEGGSGKTSFCRHYFSEEIKLLKISEFDLIKNLNTDIIAPFLINEEQARSSAILNFSRIIYQKLGTYLRTINNSGGMISFSTNENFQDIADQQIIKKDLKNRNNIGGVSYGNQMYLPEKWLLENLSKSKIIGETFSITQFWNNRNEIVEELFTNDQTLLETFLDDHFSFHSIPNKILSLINCSFINPNINFNQKSLISKFNKTSKNLNNKWRLSFSEEIIESYDQNRKKFTNDVYSSFFNRDGNRYEYHQLSDTQKLEVYSIFINMLIVEANMNFDNTVLLFDEPDAHLDPASLKYLFNFIDLFSKAKSIFLHLIVLHYYHTA